MLFWGIFTSGFIIGAMFTLFVFTKKEDSDGVGQTINLKNTDKNSIDTSNTIFDQLTKINYTKLVLTKP